MSFHKRKESSPSIETEDQAEFTKSVTFNSEVPLETMNQVQIPEYFTFRYGIQAPLVLRWVKSTVTIKNSCLQVQIYQATDVQQT